MNGDKSASDQSEEQVPRSAIERLVTYEEAWFKGNGPTVSPTGDVQSCDDLACVDLLHRVWPDSEPLVTADENAAPKILGDFRLLRELGRGGMGTVFEAEQISMGRHVALKVLPFAAMVQEKSLQRFRNEVRAAAALDHPHIVSVYSVGEERGVHFYAMQLVRGQTLADLIGELRQELRDNGVVAATDSSRAAADSEPSGTVRQALISTAVDSRRGAESYRAAARLGIQAAEALQHAHDQGVLHRDIKPSNLMLDGEGKLYVTDFGLARIEADAGLTMTGDILGTLRYMAPEQALAKRVVIDHRADIYSLGTTLYELLTLQAAFGETDRSELLKQIAFTEPLPLRKIDNRIPVELETIVTKAIAKPPEERYATAQEFAEDLRAFLEHRPIKAKPASVTNRITKWSRRHIALVWSIAAILLICSIAFSLATVYANKWYRESERQRGRANEQLFETQRQEQTATTISNLLLKLLFTANPDHEQSQNYTTRELLDDVSTELDKQLALQPEVEATIRGTIGYAYLRLDVGDKAEKHLRRALEIRRNINSNDEKLAYYLVLCASTFPSPEEQVSCAREAYRIYRSFGAVKGQLAAGGRLVMLLEAREAEALCVELIELAGNLETTPYPEMATALHSLASLQRRQGRTTEAEQNARQALALHRRLQGNEHPETAWGLVILADTLGAQKKVAAAESAYQEAISILSKRYGPNHGDVTKAKTRLLKLLRENNDDEG